MDFTYFLHYVLIVFSCIYYTGSQTGKYAVFTLYHVVNILDTHSRSTYLLYVALQLL